MKRKILYALLFMALPSFTKNQTKPKKVKIFSWWEFVAPKVLKTLEHKGYEIEIVEYRSNEVALSKLLAKKEDFDVAIISNWVLKLLVSIEMEMAEPHTYNDELAGEFPVAGVCRNIAGWPFKS